MDPLQADRSAGRDRHFPGFPTDSEAIFFSADETHIDTMKNPLYWAVLVGMTVLLMEQGRMMVFVSSLLHFFNPVWSFYVLAGCVL